MDGECDADFGLKQNHSCTNLTCIFGEIPFFCLHASPNPAPAKGNKKVWDRAGL